MDLDTRLEYLDGYELPLNPPVTLVELDFWQTLKEHRCWNSDFWLLQLKPQHVELGPPPNPQMVHHRFDTLIFDETLEIHFLSGRKLHQLGLSEDVSLNAPQMFFMRNQTYGEFEDSKLLSPTNLLIPPRIDVPTFLAEWDLPNEQKTLSLTNSVLETYTPSRQHGTVYLAAFQRFFQDSGYW